MEKKIITISREFGSGGRTVGRMVADKLGIPFYDKELVPWNPVLHPSSWKKTESILPEAACFPMPLLLRVYPV